jgi:phosphatidylglycerophosphatase A
MSSNSGVIIQKRLDGCALFAPLTMTAEIKDYQMIEKVSYVIATGLGTGLLPKAPGTWGSFLALLILFFLPKVPFLVLFLTLLTTFIGYWATQIVMQPLSDPDPKFIVIDEVTGMFLSAYFLFLFIPNASSYLLILAFILFRLFDIWKPFPISWVDSSFAGSKTFAPLGVMLDDLLAAVFVGIVFYILKGYLS